MTAVRLIWLVLCLCWIGAELVLAKRREFDDALISEKERKSRRVLWGTMLAGLGLALVFKWLAFLPVSLPYLPRQAIALLIFAAGLAMRYAAVNQLGRFFTPDVIIQHEHQLIVDGLYRRVRHPAYTGLLVAFMGAGLAMGDLIALACLTLPAFAALNYRIGIEEELLLGQFGKAYQTYRQQTKKWLPWIY